MSTKITRSVTVSRSTAARRRWLLDGWTAPAGHVARSAQDRRDVIQAGALRATLTR